MISRRRRRDLYGGDERQPTGSLSQFTIPTGVGTSSANAASSLMSSGDSDSASAVISILRRISLPKFFAKTERLQKTNCNASR